MNFRLKNFHCFDQIIDVELKNFNETWSVRLESAGNFSMYHQTGIGEILQITDTVPTRLFNANSTGLVINPNNGDYDLECRKDTVGNWLSYDSGADRVDLQTLVRFESNLSEIHAQLYESSVVPILAII